MANALLATVAILTFNGDRYLREVLTAVRSQTIDCGFEVLVVDSGSSDSTLRIVRESPAVRLHQIPNTEFGHGRTRNLAASLARGEYIAFLTQDAIPADSSWLANLLEPLRRDPEVGAVLGRQVARRAAFPLQKYEIAAAFADQGGPNNPTTFRLPQGGEEGMESAEFSRAAFYSDVNSATRIALLLGDVPYRDVDYAEDQLFARDVLARGLAKAYSPLAAVVHSNDLTLRQYAMRVYDEACGLHGAGIVPPSPNLPAMAVLVVKGVLGDSGRILGDSDYGPLAKARWLATNPLYHVTKWRAYRRARRTGWARGDADGSRSLEESQKRRARDQDTGERR